MKYIFNEAEFVTLLTLGKVKKLYSFELDTSCEDSQIVSSVYSLYKSGLVIEDDGRMVPEKKLGEIISAMADARYAVKITVESTSMP